MEVKKKQCKCCKNYSLPTNSIYEICSICGWQDDDIQNDDPDLEGGANDMSLNQAKEAFTTTSTQPFSMKCNMCITSSKRKLVVDVV